MKDSKYIYTLELTERQAKILSYACDQFARCIQGQDSAFQDLFEQAWEKRCKDATGNSMDKEWDGGWYNMRSDAEKMANDAKWRFWGLSPRTLNGVYYDDTADILFDMHCVIRHQLWIDRPEDKKFMGTVDAYEAMRFGKEPLAVIKRIENEEKERNDT